MKPLATLILAASAMLLGGCQLRPVYSSSGTAAAMLHSIAVSTIPDRSGWLVRQALIDRLGDPTATPAYRLEVELDDQIQGFGVRGDDAITRERRILRARYRLVDSATGQVLLDATAGSDAGIDVVQSEFAVLAAENTALERLSEDIADSIVTRLALFGRNQPPRQ